MAKSYYGLTGEAVVSSVRRRNIGTLVFCIFGLIACLVAIVVLLVMTAHEHRYLVTIIGLLIVALLIYAAVCGIKSACNTLKDCTRARIFRKYGSPDSIAERIAAEADTPLLSSQKALIADSFIMNRGNFESYVPFSEILLCYKKEQRTNGILTGIFLVVHDAYGDKFEYPFKLGKKHEEEMLDVMKHISTQAPKAAFGYTPENLKYAAANARQPAE